MTSKFYLLFKRPLFIVVQVNLLSSFQFCKKIANLVDFVLHISVCRKIIKDKFVYLTSRQGLRFCTSSCWLRIMESFLVSIAESEYFTTP